MWYSPRNGDLFKSHQGHPLRFGPLPPGDVGSALAEAVRWTALGGKLEEAPYDGAPVEK